MKRQSDIEEQRAKIKELIERRKREKEAKKENRTSDSPSSTRQGSGGTRREEETTRTKPPSTSHEKRFRSDDDDSDSDDRILTLPKPRAHLNFGNHIPPPPMIDTNGWSVGSETRRLHQHPDKTLTGEVKFKQSNLDHMERMTTRQFDDAKHHRETVARVQLESQKQMYKDMDRQRRSAERIQREHDMRKWEEREREQMAKVKAEAQASRHEYIDKERERNSQFRSQLLKEQADFAKQQYETEQRMKEQQFAWKRDREARDAEYEKMKEERRQRELQQQREMEENRRREQEEREERRRQREYQREMREQQNLQEQALAQMEYNDRALHRDHQRDIELGAIERHIADRNNERQYNLELVRLERISEIGDVYNRIQNAIQQRAFNAMAFHDSRVGRHRNYVKLDKEQRGIDRDVEVRDIFEAFDLGDPDMLDLTERRISQPIRVLRHAGCHSYLHTYLFTGVESVIQSPNKDPYIVFMDGSTKKIPSWNDGYSIQPRMIRPYVWIMHVYKVPLDMVDKPKRKCKRLDDSDDDEIDWKRCCKMCKKLCDVQ